MQPNKYFKPWTGSQFMTARFIGIQRRYILLLSWAAATLMFLFVSSLIHAQPQVSDTFPLTFERDDFPFAAPTVGQPTVFQTNGTTRNRFVMVFRNGLLQRACGVPTGPCDYAASGNVTITYPANVIQAGDLVTLFFYR
jgi:hypothetical protein